MKKYGRSFLNIIVALILALTFYFQGIAGVTIVHASVSGPEFSGAKNAVILKLNTKKTEKVSSNKELWYKVEIPSDGFLTVSYSSTTPGSIEILNSNLEPAVYQETSRVDTTPGTCMAAVDSGIYYIGLLWFQEEGTASVSVNFESANNNDGHNNRTFESAKEIKADETVIGLLTQNNLTDYYKFNVPAEENVKINLSAETPVILQLDNENRFSNEAIDWWKNYIQIGKGEKDSLDTKLSPGTYYLKVDQASNARNYGTYQLTLYMKETSSVASKPTSKPSAGKTVTMYRAYNPNSGEHFYTSNTKEFNYIVSLGWKNEGVGWIAPEKSNTPVYRLYNKNGGEHHYTTSAAEKNNLLKAGWSDEGIGWYSDDSKRTPLYRQYNPNAFANNHNYSTSKVENDYLVSIGWKAEGIGWYGVKAK